MLVYNPNTENGTPVPTVWAHYFAHYYGTPSHAFMAHYFTHYYGTYTTITAVMAHYCYTRCVKFLYGLGN